MYLQSEDVGARGLGWETSDSAQDLSLRFPVTNKFLAAQKSKEEHWKQWKREVTNQFSLPNTLLGVSISE